jgi:hypothetical protein
MATHTIKVTGVGDGLLELLDRRIREQHSTGRAEYIRELIRRDVLAPALGPIGELLAPVHQEGHERGYTEADIDRFAQDAMAAHRRERRGPAPEATP